MTTFNSHDSETISSSYSSLDLPSRVHVLEEEKLKLKDANATRLAEAIQQKLESGEVPSRKDIPRIQKVQPYLRNSTHFAQYYFPKLISMGPIHRGDRYSEETLKGGERYKMLWAAMYLKETDQSDLSLFEKIRRQLPALMEMYSEEVYEGFRYMGRNEEEGELAWTFLLDGCALLEFILSHKEGAAFPEAKLKIKGDQLVHVQQDLLLLENQLPYQLLTLLSNVPASELNGCIEQFLQMHQLISSTKSYREVIIKLDDDQPPHLLDLLRRSMLAALYRPAQHIRRMKKVVPKTYSYNLKEPKAAGIQVKRRTQTAPSTSLSPPVGLVAN